MPVSRYSSASDFLAHTQAMLEQHEAVNNLMLGLTDTLIRIPDRYKEWHLLTVDEGAQIKAALLWTPPHNIHIQADHPDSASMSELARYVYEHFHEQGTAVPGVTGRVEPTRAFAEAWTAVAGGSSHVHIRMRVYELRQVIPAKGVAGELRQATADDQALIAAWLHTFDREALGGSMTHEDASQRASQYIEQGAMVVWQVGGEPVSMAAKNRQTRHGAVIGMVYTSLEKRGHGYASALVAALSQKILDSGKDFCALFTNLNNPTSNSIYQIIGYKPLEDFEEIRFEPLPQA